VNLIRSSQNQTNSLTNYGILRINRTWIFLVYDNLTTSILLLQVRRFFRPVPYLAFRLYRNNVLGNGIETHNIISTGAIVVVQHSLNILFHTYFCSVGGREWVFNALSWNSNILGPTEQNYQKYFIIFIT
jgi:hypothetical protein